MTAVQQRLTFRTLLTVVAVVFVSNGVTCILLPGPVLSTFGVELESMGHRTRDPLMEVGRTIILGKHQGFVFGGGQAVMRIDRGYVAGSDSRRDGLAAAY